MRTIKVQQGQTLKDIAMQEYGCFEGLQRILELNNIGFGFLANGANVIVDDTAPVLSENNLRVVKYYQNEAVVVNSHYATKPFSSTGFPYVLPFTLN